MRLFPLLLLAALAACHADPRQSGDTRSDGSEAQASPPETPLRPASPAPRVAQGEWRQDGRALAYVDAESDAVVMRLACDEKILRVALPSVKPIGSEERLTFGGGGDVEALVAVPGLGTVEALGPAPAQKRLVALLEAGPGASYGATAIGPLVPVPADLAATFGTSCS